METKTNVDTLTKEQKAALKAQRKAEFEAKFQKEKPQVSENENKTKAQLKAERRTKQEAQRAAKLQNQTKSNQTTIPKTTTQTQPSNKVSTSPSLIETQANVSKSENKIQAIIPTPKELPNKIFSHLPRRASNLSNLSTDSIPPVVVQVGYRINKELIKGSTEKCIAMLMAFKQVVTEHEVSSKKDMKRDLQKILFNDCIKFLEKCRPLSISMTNAIKHLKLVFSRIPSESADNEVKQIITSEIDVFIEEEILCSWKAIVDCSLEKINEDDVILTLGCSTIVKHVLFNAWKNGKKFRVIVVDTRPKFVGKEMLQFLIQNEIPATYILINSISYVMKEVTKVIIEAHSLLGNGYVMSYTGSSQVSLVAKAYNVPVIVCCETYKFSERVHTDCFVHNELGGDNEQFLNSLDKKKPINVTDYPNLNVLDLLYDLTPHEFVSVIITEKGTLPCTAVPAILRARETK